jgi:hypothetical protein
VVATHEFGHFLLQQGHCNPPQPNNLSCLQGGGIMQPGQDAGVLAFHADIGGSQLFTAEQKPVIQKRCMALNPRRN